jgi:hypothetical protein
MKNRLLLLLVPSFLAACGGSSGGGGGEMAILEVGNGFGLLLPHSVFKVDAQGNPTSTLVAIRSLEDIVQNVRPGNKIHQPAVWEEAAVLPNNDPGNHFVYAKFTQPIELGSVLDANGLKGSISIVGVDGLTGATALVSGRAFVGGMAFEDGVLQPLVIDNGDPADGVVLLNPAFLEPSRASTCSRTRPRASRAPSRRPSTSAARPCPRPASRLPPRSSVRTCSSART